MTPGLVHKVFAGMSRTEEVRKRLHDIVVEGSLANVFITFTGGVFITGLALMLGANDFEIGFLAALPFIAQIAQLGSDYVAGFFRNRKTAVRDLSAFSRQIWWLLPLVLLLPGGWDLEIMLLVVLVSNVGIMTATPAWMAWMADIVPEKIRGRFFGVRSAMLAVIAVVTALAGGMILDIARKNGHESLGFGIIIVISCLCAAAALVVLNKIPDPWRKDPSLNFTWARLWEPLTNRSFRRLLQVFLAWNLSIGIAAPFFAPHMLTNLKMSFTLIAVYSGVASLSAVLLNKPWGTLIDRFGSKPVVALCGFGVAFVPFLWLIPRAGSLWILAFEAVYSGALWAGFNLAAFNIPIANSPRSNRSFYLAFFNVVTGLAFFSASVLGGVLAEMWKDVSWMVGPQKIVNYHLLFVVSGILRLIAAGLILTFHEVHEKSVPIMVQFMGYAILKKISVGRQLFPKSHRE
ncbi:MAG: MFS transporter [candidate division Zixibacteria bacterium]|nr:MFS transporter [candidate division Zixibacteria bacterium]MDD5424960.1 MFS transporter [candidate division Zixibacteria bacterium]